MVWNVVVPPISWNQIPIIRHLMSHKAGCPAEKDLIGQSGPHALSVKMTQTAFWVACVNFAH
jgi:hypothetical protein